MPRPTISVLYYRGSKGSTHTEALKPILNAYDCLPANPRKIKLLANRIAWMSRRFKSSFSDDTFQSHTENEYNRDAAIFLIIAIIYCFHRQVYEQLEKNPGYINAVIEFAKSPALQDDRRFAPMQGLVPSRDASGELPVNPSDSNVFRLHQLLQDVKAVAADKVQPLVGL